jgi:hypothetical protein
MTTEREDPQARRERRRDTLNSLIDLLEPHTPQERVDLIISAAAAVSVKVTIPAPPAARGGYRPKPRKGY